MNIAIIGSGNVGGALAQGLIKAKYNVQIGARLPLSDKSKKLATIIGQDRFASIRDSVEQSQVVIITTPPEQVLTIIAGLDNLEGKTIIDATNSFRTKPDPYPTAFHAIKALTNAERVVKCFNTTGFENMLNPKYNGVGIDMFVAGDDKDSKHLVSILSKDIGFGECYDFGGDDKVVLLEQFALGWVNLAIMQGHGRNLAIKVIKR